jgi:hypothetical protein
MIGWFRQLDDLLRGKTTSPENLTEGTMHLALRQFVPLAVFLGATYGFFMGWYALSAYLGGLKTDPHRWQQIIACMVKLPALFLLTLMVTFPSLYVFNTLVGCRLSFISTLRLLVGAVVVNVAVAASLGPILGFFTLSTTSYPFMVLLNVLLLAIAGLVALAFLLHTLRRLARLTAPPSPSRPPRPPRPPEEGEEGTVVYTAPPPSELPTHVPGPLERLPSPVADEAIGQAKNIFVIWLLIYGLVGAQMGWLLRPFIGRPDIPFEWFRGREGNFFMAVGQCLHQLLGIRASGW